MSWAELSCAEHCWRYASPPTNGALTGRCGLLTRPTGVPPVDCTCCARPRKGMCVWAVGQARVCVLWVKLGHTCVCCGSSYCMCVCAVGQARAYVCVCCGPSKGMCVCVCVSVGQARAYVCVLWAKQGHMYVCCGPSKGICVCVCCGPSKGMCVYVCVLAKQGPPVCTLSLPACASLHARHSSSEHSSLP